MLSITELAAEKAKEILEHEGKAEWGLRIFIAGGGCCGPAYGMDVDEHPKENDDVVEKNGLKVFADAETSRKLEGMLMDFYDDGQNQGFVIKQQSGQAPSCNCGSDDCR